MAGSISLLHTGCREVLYVTNLRLMQWSFSDHERQVCAVPFDSWSPWVVCNVECSAYIYIYMFHQLFLVKKCQRHIMEACSHQPSMSSKHKQLTVEPSVCHFTLFILVVILMRKKNIFLTYSIFLSSFRRLDKANFTCATVTVRKSSRRWLARDVFVSLPVSTLSACGVLNRTLRLACFHHPPASSIERQNNH